MSTLDIGHWHNRYHARALLAPGQRAAWDDCIDDIDLSREVDALLSPDELVFIRRLHLSTSIRHDGSAWQLAALWREALLAALGREITTSAEEENVVRYRCRRDALADMLYRACCRDASRDWVWIQMALLPAGVHSADTVMLRAIQELQREPAAIWPALTCLVKAEAHTGALTLLLRHVPSHVLGDLLHACPQSALYQRAPASTASVDIVIDVMAPLVAALLAWRASHPVLAQNRQHALTVLLATAASPAISTSTPGSIANVLAACARLLQAPDAPRHLRAAPRLAIVPAPDNKPAAVRPQAVAPEEPQPAPALVDAVERVATEYAGLLFLLHLLPAAGLLEHVEALAPDQLPHVLWHMATRILGIPVDDPVVRAFCGGWQPEGALPDPHGALALPAELVAHNVTDYVAQRLPDTTLTAILQRPGTIHFEAGWIEACMPARSAETILRRAGLDLDPGWLPWLGCVVRFVYE